MGWREEEEEEEYKFTTLALACTQLSLSSLDCLVIMPLGFSFSLMEQTLPEAHPQRSQADKTHSDT